MKVKILNFKFSISAVTAKMSKEKKRLYCVESKQQNQRWLILLSSTEQTEQPETYLQSVCFLDSETLLKRKQKCKLGDAFIHTR